MVTKKPAKASPSHAEPAPTRLTGLPPVISGTTVLLILGSFPGAASLAAQQYYAHPQNHFWRILQAIWPSSPRPLDFESYENKSKWLLDHGLGLWDVYASCERMGSLDSAIRHPVVNDFAALARRLPRLSAIAHNGGESFKHTHRIHDPRLQTHKLPSTSAANASWSFDRKVAAWRAVFVQHGLV